MNLRRSEPLGVPEAQARASKSPASVLRCHFYHVRASIDMRGEFGPPEDRFGKTSDRI